jgi:trimeric autotransporter adhesin
MIARTFTCTLALLLIGGTTAAQARTYVVTNRTDPKPGACTASDCTLREAVIAANRHHGADTILLPSRKRYVLTLQSTGEDRSANGDLDVTSGRLKIAHPGRGTATIDAKQTDRVFDIAATTTLDKLTIRGGYSNKTDEDGDGGGIVVSRGSLTVLDSHVVHNRAPWVGGNGAGIDSDTSGMVKVVDSDVSHNDSGGSGGGIEASTNGRLVILRSTVAANKAAQAGGVMTFGPVVRIVESTIANNLAAAGPGVEGDGGGVFVGRGGRAELTNSTVAGNGAYTSGGGIFSDAGSNATISFSTVVRNRADADHANGGTTGGVHLRTQGVQVAARARITNSVLALNTEANGVVTDCGGIGFLGTGVNLISSTSQGKCSEGTPIVAADPRLGPLAPNGGPTQTVALLSGSPAIGAAVGRAPRYDQRGVRRKDPDLGAYERR